MIIMPYEFKNKKNISTIGVHAGQEEVDHSIESVFQAVDLCDELTVEKKAGEPLCRIKTDTALPAENTLTTAYGEFCNKLEERKNREFSKVLLG